MKNCHEQKLSSVAKKHAMVYACSSCSDVGELAGRIARPLTHKGVAEMSCLASIGGRVKALVNRAAAAKLIIADVLQRS